MTQPMTIPVSQRRYDLDWLRLFATFTVFLYHSTRFFNLGDWHIKNETTYVWVEIWWVFVTRWMMPLFFVISGASLFYAIGRSAGWKRFHVDKFKRLMIPVLAASVTHGAVLVYLEGLDNGRLSGGFFSFIPEYFTGVYTGIGSATGNFNFLGTHLWYLLFLFVYGLICYPLFAWLERGGRQVLDRVAGFLATPGLIYFWFTIPLWLMDQLLPRNLLNTGTASWGFAYHIWFLIAGFILVSSDRLQQTIKKQFWVSSSLSLILSFVYLARLFGGDPSFFKLIDDHRVMTLLSYLVCWCWILAILGFGRRYLDFNRPSLKGMNEGVLPFFIMHMTVLMVLGHFIISWPIHDVLKWPIVFFSSLVVILSLYVLFIRRLDSLRFLFGLKTSRPFYRVFDNGIVLAILAALWIGLTIFSGFNHRPNENWRQTSLPARYDKEQDILLNEASITRRSNSGVRIVEDANTSMGQAMEFYGGAKPQVEPDPEAYVDFRFTAPAGRYYVWLRGKSDGGSELTDSIWLQVDDQIGSDQGSPHLGNWNSFQPVGRYSWASNTYLRHPVVLRFSGEHRIRVQPRQTPHRIDQIWFSRRQERIPDTNSPVK